MAKTIFKVDSPYTRVEWPHIPNAEHDMMLEMLVNLLSPIGHHRSLHVTPSKGKHSNKHKQHEDEAAPNPAATPPMPEIFNFVTVCINSTTSYLERLAAANLPQVLRYQDQENISAMPTKGESADSSTLPFPVVIFLLKPPEDITHAHLPLLSRTASRARPTGMATRIVPLRVSSEEKLASALGLPRIGVVGLIEGAPNADLLIDYVRSHIPAIDVPWISEAQKGKYLGVNIQAVGSGTVTALEVRGMQNQGGQKSDNKKKS